MNLTKPTKASEIQREWHFFDMKGKVLGRETTKMARLLMGKSKPYFVTHLDCGDYVVVVNAKEVVVTGKKASQKIYSRYSGFPGGLTKKTFAKVLVENPTRIIKEAVAGMLPKNKLRALMLKRLYVFADGKHPYEDKVQISNLQSQNQN